MTTPLKCVVDASVGIKQFIPDPLSLKATLLFAHLANPHSEIYVPDLFYIEVANTLWKYIRAGQITPEKAQADLITLKAFPLRVVSTANLMAQAVTVGVTHGISAYDACYVSLAQQVNAPLLTLDRRLVNTLTTSTYDVCLFNDFSIPPPPT